MRALTLAAAGLVCILLSGCTSPEEQRAQDQQTCLGYGFQPGTDTFANCMMRTSQQRAAEQAADQRQRSANDAAAREAQKDREQQDRRAQEAKDAVDSARVQQLMSPTSSDSMGIPKVEVPKVEAPKIDMPNMSGMHCTSSSSGNAGSLSCSN